MMKIRLIRTNRSMWVRFMPLLAAHGLIARNRLLFGETVAGLAKEPFAWTNSVLRFSAASSRAAGTLLDRRRDHLVDRRSDRGAIAGAGAQGARANRPAQRGAAVAGRISASSAATPSPSGRTNSGLISMLAKRPACAAANTDRRDKASASASTSPGGQPRAPWSNAAPRISP